MCAVKKHEPEYSRITDIRRSPIRRDSLPEALLSRITAIHEILRDVKNGTLEEMIEDFRRDADPDREIIIWEKIASAYVDYTTSYELPNEARREVLSVLLIASMGGSLEDCGLELRCLTPAQVKAVFQEYQSIFRVN